MDRTNKRYWSSQKSEIVDYITEGNEFAECNQACDDHSPNFWLEGQGHTEMEQFAEKFVLRIWRLTNGVVGLGLLWPCFVAT